MIKYAVWAALSWLAAPAGFGACADCPAPGATPAFPVYPGARDYAESRLFFEGGFLWRSGYRTAAAATALMDWYRALLVPNGWLEAAAEQRQILNDFFGQAPDVMTSFRKEDVALTLAHFTTADEDDNYVMVNIRFPWMLAGGPGGFGRERSLYPAGDVLFRMYQIMPDHVLAYEMAQCADSPAAVLPFVTMELQQRGWNIDQERALFRAQLGFDDNIRLFYNAAGESYAVMAVNGDAFSWYYVFLQKTGAAGAVIRPDMSAPAQGLANHGERTGWK